MATLAPTRPGSDPRPSARGASPGGRGGSGVAESLYGNEGDLVYRISSKPEEDAAFARERERPQTRAQSRATDAARSQGNADAAKASTSMRKSRNRRPLWIIAGVLLLMLSLGYGAASLAHEREENTRLHQQVAGLRERVQFQETALRDAKASLSGSEADRGRMVDALRGSMKTEKNLREDVADLQYLHQEERKDKAKEVQSWTDYSQKLADAANQTNALRQQEQAAASEEISRMEDHTSKLTQANDQLARTANEWQHSAENLAGMNRGLQSDLERAKSCLNSLEGENRSLQSCNLQLHGEVGNLQSCISGLRSTICSLEARIRCLESELSQEKGKTKK